MGIVNGLANTMGIVVPMIVALMVEGNVSVYENNNNLYSKPIVLEVI